MNWQEEDLKYIWHPCSQMKDYESLPPIVIDVLLNVICDGVEAVNPSAVVVLDQAIPSTKKLEVVETFAPLLSLFAPK